jgi:sulfite exporter TauE/SafE
MCGPIALAVPVKSSSQGARIASILLYNAGRVLTYALLGGIFGIFGQGLFLMGIQQQLSIILGALIVISAVLILVNRKVDFTSKLLTGKVLRLQQGMKKYLQKQGYTNNFILGLLNGLLPCGLVYFALVGALATGNTFSGMIFMVMFGIGTMPVMVLLPWIKDYLTTSFRQKLQKTIPVMLIVFGGLLIVRGANLGIPYLSPKVEKPQVTTLENGEPKVEECTVKCCH